MQEKEAIREVVATVREEVRMSWPDTGAVPQLPHTPGKVLKYPPCNTYGCISEKS